ncbi:glycosyltransferase involved in cell wall biosynthesis [Pontibacter ummariensis]|uniref:Glycosyltransferase involved in cell wall bisynthesis n=1 Tax=Pontibacter ummariensis TaxID=1610492 RepID=A0A239ELD0_9BACT|nr:glycosyltransferase family 4 protein [Pontibacter ummariensis]PRY13324.1 glycosyltransferase involved in cell wall biosynthesis [Pontibacter ummariensis]SNS45475.1 Glycosyltransferase involved in cell wall bisynthesis [Pontibacter ummariensis]
MKVLHILSELKFSGAELMLYTASTKFKKAKLQVTVLSTGTEEGVYARYYRELGWNVEHIPFKKNFQFFKELFDYLNNSAFDVVHIHRESAFIYTAFTAYLAGTKKIVRTVHNNFIFYGTLKVRRRIHHMIAQKLLKVSFIAISGSVEETELYLYKTKTVLINNWIDLNLYNKSSSSFLSNNFDSQLTRLCFVSVGSCSVVKNHKACLYLIKLLIDKGISCQYIHVGCGDLEGEEKNWVRENNLENHVQFTGNTDQVATYLAMSNIYLMPSLFEGIGNACLEAMASSLLCVVNNVPGLNTLIKNGETGLVVDFSNIEEVAERVVSTFNDKLRYDSIRRAARSYVTENHGLSNIDKMVLSYQAR